jgi:hypothetical protein
VRAAARAPQKRWRAGRLRRRGLLAAKLGSSTYDLPGFIHFSVDLRALAGAVVLSVLISFLIGVVPARKSLKVSLQEELQSEGKGHSHSAGTAFTRSFLAVSAILPCWGFSLPRLELSLPCSGLSLPCSGLSLPCSELSLPCSGFSLL